MSSTRTQIGKYRIDGELGRGAMGVVYRAFDLVVERPVALKTLFVSTTDGLDLLETLRREAKSVGRFEHANIVTLYDAGEMDGVFCMVMQLVEGQSLRDAMERQRWFKAAQIVDMFRQILAGLGYAHERGIVHRDIKPANIMISAEGVVKLADFGIAKLIDPRASSSGIVIGTPSYMSPEQVLGRPLDGRSDIFSVGCTLYEVLTGEKAFGGDSASSIMYKIVHEAPAPPARLRPGTDPRLEAVALKALANAPEDRYADCGEMMRALVGCLHGPTPLPVEGNTVGNSGHGKTAGRGRMGWLAGAGVLAILTIGVLVFAARRPAHSEAAVGQVAPALSPVPAATPLPVPAAGPSPSPGPVAPVVSDLPAQGKRQRQVGRPVATEAPQAKQPALITESRTMRPAMPAEDFTGFLLRGDTAFQEGDYEGALAAYFRAEALKPGDAGVRRKLKVVLTLLGRTAEAQRYR